jgi:hypothetical protein
MLHDYTHKKLSWPARACPRNLTDKRQKTNMQKAGVSGLGAVVETFNSFIHLQ